MQLLLLTLGEGYLLTAAPPDLERGIAPLGPPAPAQPPLLGRGVAPLGRAMCAGHSRPRYKYPASLQILVDLVACQRIS